MTYTYGTNVVYGTFHVMQAGGVATRCGIDTTPKPGRPDGWRFQPEITPRERSYLCRRCARLTE